MTALSVVIPAYREADALDLLLPRLKTSIGQLTDDAEILVIDSQAPLDETEQVCRTHGVTHVRREAGNFYGDAVRTGVSRAAGEYILFMDADGSHNPAQIVLLWDRREQADIVIGSRYVEGGMTENPAILIFLSWVVNVTYRVVFRLRVKDVSNSFRLYRSAVLKPLRLRCDNFDIIQEVLLKINRRCGSHRIVEVPVTFEKRKRGQSKRNLFLFALSYVATIVRLIYTSSRD